MPKREFTRDPLVPDREWFLTEQGLSAYVKRLTALGKEGWIGVAPGLGGNGSDLMTVAQPTKRDAADAVEDGLRANQVASAPEVETEGLVKVDLLAPDEVDTEVVTHWGCKMPGGNIRWDPQYGRGPDAFPPYTEAQARDDVKRNPGTTLVTRTETTTVTTTAWREV